MSVGRNKTVVRRLFEVWNTGKLDAIEELYAAEPDNLAALHQLGVVSTPRAE